MEYKVFSRKYRPQTFDEIVGQDHISQTLQKAITSDRISHAYLFTGSRGIGKTTTARILAKSLNCLDPDGVNPCNECQNCKEITAGNSVNVIEIDGASNRGIDEVRELRENVKYPPSNANYRVFIIDEVHMLTNPAFNALLKTLEEPPDHVIFIFATTEPVKVPETILSRCQRYDFHRIPVSTLVKQLNYIADQEGIEVSDDILTLIAKKADGAMRDAESLLDQIVAFSDEKVDPDKAKQVLGLIDYEYYLKIGELIRDQNQKELLFSAEEIFNKGVELGEFFTGLSEHFRNIMIAKKADSVDMLDLPGNVKEMYMEEAQEWQFEDLLRLIQLLSEAHSQLKSAVNQRTHLEFTLLRMGTMDRTVTIQEIIDKFQGGTATKNSNTKSTTASKSKRPWKNSSSKNSSKKNLKTKTNKSKSNKKKDKSQKKLKKVEKDWPDVKKKIAQRKPSVSNFLDQCEIDFKNNQNNIVLRFHTKNKVGYQTVNSNIGIIKTIIQNLYGLRVGINCTYSDDVQINHADTSKLDEVTNKISDEFDGEIIL